MLFLGMSNAYVMRTNMSVAIVAMVNHSALPVDKDFVDDECVGGTTNVTVSNFLVISKDKDTILNPMK